MTYSVNYDKENGCILVSVRGDFNLSALKTFAPEVGKLLKENNCRCILNDMRDANLSDSITNTYLMPGTALRSGVRRGIKRALVVSEISQAFLFLETVFLNSGNMVKMFLDIDEAAKWLSIQPSADQSEN